MYQMDRKIHSSRHFKPAHRKGTAAMKTASLALPANNLRWTAFSLVARYLPHLIVITLLLGVLVLASYGAPVHHPSHPVFPLGQHL